MDWSQLFFELLDVLGTVSFALSGAMLAVKKQTDLFGVMLMGIVSAVGGGVTRDVLLGSVPPAAFTNSRYVLMAAVTSAVLFLIARWQKELYLTRADLVDKINFYLAHDAKREEIARAGHEIVKKNFTYEILFDKIFSEV